MVRIILVLAAVLAVCVGRGTGSDAADLVRGPQAPQGPQAGRAAGKEQLMVDGLVDNVLYTVRRELDRVGLGTTELPDIRDVQQGRLQLTLTEGMMHSLSSLHRSAAGALVEYGSGNVSLSTTLSLETLEIGYLVSAKYAFLPAVQSAVGAVVRTHSLRLASGIYYAGDACRVGVESVAVTALRDIEWRVSGFGAINSVVSAALNLLVPPDQIRGWLNDAFREALRRYRVPCHQLIPGLGGGAGAGWPC